MHHIFLHIFDIWHLPPYIKQLIFSSKYPIYDMLLQISDKWYLPPYIINMIFSSIYLYIPLYIPIYPIYDMFIHKSSIENINPVENVVCKPGKESCTSIDMEVATRHHHHHHHHHHRKSSSPNQDHIYLSNIFMARNMCWLLMIKTQVCTDSTEEECSTRLDKVNEFWSLY